MPFYNLSDREFNFVNGSHQIEQNIDIDLYNMIPNPDKSDETDPDLMFMFPKSDYYTISKMYDALIEFFKTSVSRLLKFHKPLQAKWVSTWLELVIRGSAVLFWLLFEFEYQ